jgi:hypothetical protein
MGCPCKEGRYGAFGLVVSLYWAMQCGGFAAMFNLVTAETALGVWWAIWTGLSVLALIEGIRQARSHDDNFDGQSVLVSVGLIGLAMCAFANHWFYLTNDWVGHASRVFWFGLIGSEVFNLWLNFRGRRHAVPVPVEPPRRSPRFRLRRSRTIKVIEELEGRGIDADDLARLLANHLGQNTRLAPPHIAPSVGHDGQPVQLVYVRDERTGEFIPVRLPVPVGRLPR